MSTRSMIARSTPRRDTPRLNPIETPYVLGVDLGQKNDYSALALLETQVFVTQRLLDAYPWPIEAGWNSPAGLGPATLSAVHGNENDGWPGKPPLDLRYLDRVRDRPYPAIVDDVVNLLARPPLSTLGCALVVDATGVGAAVVDLFRQAGLKPLAVTIHGGDRVTRDRSGARVPKRDLVSSVQSVLQTGRLRVAEELALAPILREEMQNFRVKIDPKTSHDSYSGDWRAGAHDDLVLAVALACWYRDWFWRNWDAARLRRQAA